MRRVSLFIYLFIYFYSHNETATGESRSAGGVCFFLSLDLTPV